MDCQRRAPKMGLDGSLRQPPFPQTTSTTVHVDSRDRDFTTHPSSSSFVVRLPEPLKNVSSAVLVAAELPLTYYVFSAANRQNTSISVALGGGAPVTATIPDGNYDRTTMAAAVQTAVRAATGDATVTVTIDAATMKCTVAHPTLTVTVGATVSDRSTGWGLAYYLGFPKAGVADAAAPGGATGTSVVSLNPENYVLLEIDELNGLNQGAIYSSGGSGQRTFAKVPLNGNSYDFTFVYDKVTCVDLRPPTARLDKLTVAVRFHDGTLVDLNGGEWSFSIEFACTLARSP